MAEHKPRKMYHMLPRDREIWQRFLLGHEDEFELFEYDVLCGPKLRVESEELPWLGDLSERLMSLRIDVLAHKKGETWLIEVKPNAGLSALGQLMAYRYYLNPNKYEPNELKAVIVTDYARHYMPELDKAFEIARVVV